MHKSNEKTIFGLEPAEFIGLIIMLIPIIISFLTFPTKERVIPFLPWPTKTTRNGMNPGLTSGLIAIIFYFSLIIRYDFFKTEGITETIVSSIRFFINCWGIATFLSPIASSSSTIKLLVFEFNTVTLLLLAVILSWLGEKKLAGYSWILFVIAAVKEWNSLDKIMGPIGTLFIITFSLSLFLQVRDITKIKNYGADVMEHLSNHAPNIKEQINLAKDDATEKAKKAATVTASAAKTIASAYAPNVIKKGASNKTESPTYHISKDGATLSQTSQKTQTASSILESLDVNNDGVIDEKDFEILNSFKKKQP